MKRKKEVRIERLVFPLSDLKVEERADNDPQIVGHAAVFDELSEELWGFREKIQAGAFSDAIKEDDVRALINHDPQFVLGRSSAGTLTMSEDDKGLRVVIDPHTTTFAADLMVSMQRGDIDQMSFGFQVVDERWETKDKENIRILEKVRLFDVSVVTFPAYPQTDVGLRMWQEVGIDHEAFSRVLTRVAKGIPLTDEDKAVLSSSAETLRAVQEVEKENDASGAPEHKEDEETPRSRLSLLKLKQRQLMLRR